MKINFKLMAMTAAALLAMNSCTQEEDVTTGTEQKGTPVTFQMGVNAISRTVTEDNSFATTFTEGDEVGIFAYNGSTPVATNARYRYNGSAWEAQGEAIYAEEGISYSYYAYYPYSETATDINSIELSVATDQTAGYTGSDALIARNEDVTAGTTTVTLQYSHAFALVQVSLSGDEAAQDATVTLQNVYPTAIINLQSGEVGEATGTQGTVAMKAASTNTATAPYSFRAIVPAQTITANTAILTTTSNGTTYRFSYSADVPYEEGKLRQINVTLGTPSGSEITIDGADDVINDWEASEDVSGEGSVEEVVDPVTTPFSLDFSAISNFTEISGNWASSPIPSGNQLVWYHREADHSNNSTTPSVENIDGTSVLQLSNSVRGSWNGSNVVCHYPGLFERDAVYQVVITATNETGQSDGVLGITVSTSDDSKRFKMMNNAISESNTWDRNVTTFNNLAGGSKTFYLDMSQASVAGSSGSSMPGEQPFEATTDADVANGINITLYNYTTRVPNVLQINSVTISKVEETTE